MQITTRHPKSLHGVPVILNDNGKLMTHKAGIQAIRAALGLTAKQLAEKCGVSFKTLQGWEYGKPPNVAALLVMRDLLAGDACPECGREKP